MIRNHPSLIKNVNNFSAYKIALENEVRNCEDVVLNEKRGVVIFSCDAGRDRWNTVMVSLGFCFLFDLEWGKEVVYGRLGGLLMLMFLIGNFHRSNENSWCTLVHQIPPILLGRKTTDPKTGTGRLHHESSSEFPSSRTRLQSRN